MGKIFYIIGKSSTGKDHIYERLLAEGLGFVPMVMYSTRPMREGEEDGREYWFVSEEEHLRLREAGKIIEERTYNTVHGPWHYFTADDGRIDLQNHNYLNASGTLESYNGVRAFYGEDALVPIYLEADDDIRLIRYIERERKQEHPKYTEICRRFLADDEDYSEDKIREAGITRRIPNNGTLAECYAEVLAYVKSML